MSALLVAIALMACPFNRSEGSCSIAAGECCPLLMDRNDDFHSPPPPGVVPPRLSWTLWIVVTYRGRIIGVKDFPGWAYEAACTLKGESVQIADDLITVDYWCEAVQ